MGLNFEELFDVQIHTQIHTTFGIIFFKFWKLSLNKMKTTIILKPYTCNILITVIKIQQISLDIDMKETEVSKLY